MKEVFLDYNSTTPLSAEARAAMEPFWKDVYGNASSLHRAGQAARHAIETSREEIARAIGAAPGDLTFCSGGTEANNIGLKGLARSRATEGKRHLVVSAIEHPCVLDTARELVRAESFTLTEVPVGADGRVDPAAVARAIKADTALVSVMHVNNETGIIQPMREIGEIAHAKGVPFHVDAVQSFGKIACDVREMACDVATVSAHKIYGPKGAGALWTRRGLKLLALMHGGHQEKNLRPGTENVAAIAGFAAAAHHAVGHMAEKASRLTRMRDALWQGISGSVAGVRRNGDPRYCVSQTLNISFEGIDGPVLAMNLDLAGIYVSTGPACTAGTPEPSHVLLAMGLGPLARGGVRISLGRFSTDDDVKRLIEELPVIVDRMRGKKPGC